MVNRWTGVGRLGKDVELRYTSTGKAVASFTMAVDGGKDQTEWVTVNVWEKTAENCAKYIGKGSLVYVEGPLKTRSWDGEDGNKRYKTEVTGNVVRFLDKKKVDEEDRAPAANGEDSSIPF